MAKTLIAVRIDPRVLLEFKAWCRQREKTVTGELEAFMRSTVSASQRAERTLADRPAPRPISPPPDRQVVIDRD